jgi:hypothetical protein
MVANYSHNQQWCMGIESQVLVTANVFLMRGLRMVFADVGFESHSNEPIAMPADKPYT